MMSEPSWTCVILSSTLLIDFDESVHSVYRWLMIQMNTPHYLSSHEESEEKDNSVDYFSDDESVKQSWRHVHCEQLSWFTTTLCAREGFKWTSATPSRNRQTPAHNIIRELSGHTTDGRASGNTLHKGYKENLLFSDDSIRVIVIKLNGEVAEVWARISENKSKYNPYDEIKVKAFWGNYSRKIIYLTHDVVTVQSQLIIKRDS